MGTLYFGDNLEILRKYIQDETIDLIYLDPPFNSKRDYNLLFKTPKGHISDAQISAFEDTWHWGEQAEREFNELLHQSNTDVSETIQAFRRFLDQSDMMAYLVMMTNRLLELHRVLKPTGSLYLHCDPTASHYLKILLDIIFGAVYFRNEVIWKRTSAHSSAKRYGSIHDTILFFTKTSTYIWNDIYTPYDQEYINTFFDQMDKDGKRYKRMDLTGAGTTNGPSGDPWRGIDVRSKGRHWAYIPTELDRLDSTGRIHWPKKEGGMPRLIQYPEDLPGIPLQDIFTDIRVMHNLSSERLGYPTQKPLALLERIIQASSNPGDLVLDPFCGCGTAVHAAQKLGRDWIGIDITHLAIGLIERRMKDAFPGISFEVYGTPKDLGGARELAQRDKYEFQWWACNLVNAHGYKGKKKGADSGIDGLIYFQDDDTGAKKIIVSVKGGENVGVGMVKDLIATVEREKAAIGLFVTLAEPTRPMITEALSAGFYHSPKGDVPKIQILTIEDLLSGKAKPQYYDLSSGLHTFKKTKAEKPKAKQGKLFDTKN